MDGSLGEEKKRRKMVCIRICLFASLSNSHLISSRADLAKSVLLRVCLSCYFVFLS